MLALQYKEDEPRNIHYLFKWRPAHHAVYWFDLRLAQNRGLELWQTINNAIILYGSIPTHFLVKVVRRKLDDAEVEILCEKEQSWTKSRDLEGSSQLQVGADFLYARTGYQ